MQLLLGHAPAKGAATRCCNVALSPCHNQNRIMKTKTIIKFITATAIGLASASRAEETNKWTFDVTLYGLAASMSGDAMVKGIPVNDVDIGFDKIWENLNLAAMGTVRLGYGRWGFSTDVIYMDLQ